VRLNKFKNLLPQNVPQPEGSDDYFKTLANLQEDKPKSRVLPIITTVAAAVAIVVIVAIWAIIGRGIRQGAVIVPADKYENVELYKQEVTPNLIHEIGAIIQNNRLDFFPAFDRENPLTQDQLIYLCEQTHYDLVEDLLLTKEEFENFVYDTFGYKATLKKDIKYDKPPSYIVCMEMEGATIMSYSVSETFENGLKVAEVGLQYSNLLEKVRWVLNSQNELEYIISIIHEEKIYPTPKRDKTITNEMRETYFDFVIDYRVDAMPEFSEGELPDSKNIKLYALHLIGPNYSEPDNMPIDIEEVQKAAKDRFGIDNIKNEDMDYAVSVTDLTELPYAELIGYNSEQTDKSTVITATVGIYRPYEEYTVEFQHSLEYYRNKIIEGNEYKPYFYRICIFKYIAKDDGVTPEKFIEVKHINNSQDEFWSFFE